MYLTLCRRNSDIVWHVVITKWGASLYEYMLSALCGHFDGIRDDVIRGTCNTHGDVRNARKTFIRNHEGTVLGLLRRWRQHNPSKRRWCYYSTQNHVPEVFVSDAVKNSYQHEGAILQDADISDDNIKMYIYCQMNAYEAWLHIPDR